MEPLGQWSGGMRQEAGEVSVALGGKCMSVGDAHGIHMSVCHE